MLVRSFVAALAIAMVPLQAPLAAGPNGDWSCHMGDHHAGTLNMRSQSYIFTGQSGQMSGEYDVSQQDVTITNGPLKGMGIDHGTLKSTQTPRTLEFAAVSGVPLQCKEVL
jgi:hypothetical protein